MMENDRGSRLFGIQHKLIRQFDADTLGFDQLKQLCLVLDIGAGGVTKAVTRALIALFEQFGEFGCVVIVDSELFTDPFVSHFGERLGRLHRKTVEQKIFGVIVVLEQPGRMFGSLPAHRHKMKGYDIDLSAFF